MAGAHVKHIANTGMNLRQKTPISIKMAAGMAGVDVYAENVVGLP
jgi:hypothetical protein